jgi:hypothetical protein
MLILPAQHIIRKLPENYREGELNFCKAEFAYNTDAIEQLHFKRAYVTFNGLLYDENYKVVKASLINPGNYTSLGRFRHFKKWF